MELRHFVFTVALVLALTGANAQTVHFLGGPDSDITNLPAAPTGPCFFGNLRTPGDLEPFGVDILSCHAEIDSIACGCDQGWLAFEVHLLLANPTDGPAGGDILICVDGQGWGTYPSGCLEPHPGYWGELLTASFSITLPEPGYYELVVADTSPCAYFSYQYFLECHMWNDSEIRLVVDADGARECEVLTAAHIGERWWWTDLHDGGLWQPTSGAPIWWVEARCCETPVATESKSLGSVRSIYK